RRDTLLRRCLACSPCTEARPGREEGPGRSLQPAGGERRRPVRHAGEWGATPPAWRAALACAGGRQSRAGRLLPRLAAVRDGVTPRGQDDPSRLQRFRCVHKVWPSLFQAKTGPLSLSLHSGAARTRPGCRRL
ncbi:hypothetical protein NDU88_000889, partial [Pleurodeles waltl]